MRFFERRARIPAGIAARLQGGHRPLAHAQAEDGSWLVGTRTALVVVGPDSTRQMPWERLESARWDKDAAALIVLEIGEFGLPRPQHRFVLHEEPHRLLQLVRERVTASIVLVRRVPVSAKQGFSIIGRRPPDGGPVAWMQEYDVGIDPDDPAVVALAQRATADARAEVGE